MIASLDAEDRTELHCTVRDIESDAKVTNNNFKKLRWRYCNTVKAKY